MATDEWVKAAMTDDSLVVELLLRLKHSHASPPDKLTEVLAPFKWGIRQPRSRSALRCDAVLFRKDGEPTRCSPTTPLSWSGGSPSAATADGFEASSRPLNRSPPARSKAAITNEAASVLSKKSRKKKTFAELKEEENVLLKERIYLKKELATLRATWKEQRAENESLKRMKLDQVTQSMKQTTAASNERKHKHFNHPRKIEASSLHQSPLLSPQPDFPYLQKGDASQGRNFVLPDLNMIPSEDSWRL